MYHHPPGGVVATWWVTIELDLLLKKIARRDSLAFEQLYPVLKPNLSRFLLWKFNSLDDHEIETLVQQTLLRVWEKAYTYNGRSDSSAKNWIVTIAKNLTIDYLDERRRQVSLDALLEDGTPEFAYKASTGGNLLEEITIINEKFLRLKKFLTPREQQVFELLLEEHTQKDIARILRIAPPRVNQLIGAIGRKIRSIDS